MGFTSIEEEHFLDSVLKSWIYYLELSDTFSGVDITLKRPDVDNEFKLPCIVIKRVGNDQFQVARNAGFYKNTEGDDSTELIELRGYRYTSMLQFDLYATTIGKLNDMISKMFLKLRGFEDVFADGRWISWTSIPLYNFALTTKNYKWDTDLSICWRYHVDVSSNEWPIWDPELHLYNISVDFWVDYLKPYKYPIISKVKTTATIATE